MIMGPRDGGSGLDPIGRPTRATKKRGGGGGGERMLLVGRIAMEKAAAGSHHFRERTRRTAASAALAFHDGPRTFGEWAPGRSRVEEK